MKTGMALRALTLAGVLIGGLVLGGCSAPPDDVIQNAIINDHAALKANVYRLTDYEVINSYDQELMGETVYVVEYVGSVEPNNAAPGTNTETISGTLSLVERGNSWYAE